MKTVSLLKSCSINMYNVKQLKGSSDKFLYPFSRSIKCNVLSSKEDIMRSAFFSPVF